MDHLAVSPRFFPSEVGEEDWKERDYFTKEMWFKGAVGWRDMLLLTG